jgi:hypothetical protein
MNKLKFINDFPLSVLNDPPTYSSWPKYDGLGLISWLEDPRERSDTHSNSLENEGKRIYLPKIDNKYTHLSLSFAILNLMDNKLGGYPDKHDPVGFVWVLKPKKESFRGYICKGNAFTNGWGSIINGDQIGFILEIRIGGFASLGISIFDVPFKFPVKTCLPFRWNNIGEEDFERLMFRLFNEMKDKFLNVQWLQKINSPDGGRDISANRLNGNRVMIQARHQKNTINAPNVNDLVVKAETWNPPFDEVIVVTTSTFSQEAIRWVENHNLNNSNRPKVTIQPVGHIEVMLSKYPKLLSHLGLR